ncbi:MAG TPA: hypothetical protein VM733_13980 [Thermoanaerobaculia bacterium]|nr:hypothetical protein [Thermoanaerobaculia bacterium]
MAMKVRKVLRPIQEGDHVTVAQARAALLELIRRGEVPPPEPLPKKPRQRKTAAKAE